MGFTREPAETFSLHDPASNTTYYFDVSFLLSHYECTYGRGCKGTHLNPSHGCCAIGAHYYDEDDLAKVNAVVDRLPDSAFTNAKEIRKRHSVKHQSGEVKTRVLNGVCIFANDASHPNGAGCSLHQAAMAAGDAANHIDWKPSICSWVPLNIVDVEESDYEDEPDKLFIGRFENEDWNGGDAMTQEWYCLDDVDNFNARSPLYTTMQRELLSMLGGSEDLLRQLNNYLDRRVGEEQVYNERYSASVSRVPVHIRARKPPIAYGTTDGTRPAEWIE